MGRIKTQQVKRATYELMNLYGKRFTKDFEKNKEIIKTIMTTPSKKLRNTITGYVTRLAKKGYTSAPTAHFSKKEENI